MDATTTRVIVGAVSASKNCNRLLSHYWLSLDWRPYWSGKWTNEAEVVFISEQELWMYNIESDSCYKMMNLKEMGLADLDQIPTQILQFDMDRSYFYWINSSSYMIQTFSWKTGRVDVLKELRIFEAEKQEKKHNLSFPIHDPMNYIVSLSIYTPAARPYPFIFECLIPDLHITITMTNVTNAIVALEMIRNISDICKRTNRPPLQLNMSCTAVDGLHPCDIGVKLYRGWSERYATELKELEKGKKYVITVEASIIAKEKLSKIFQRSFTAELPKVAENAKLERDLIIAFAVVCIFLISLTAFYFGWYRKRKAMRDFLRRERIDASELTLIRQLGQGKFGEVWLAHYDPSDHRDRDRKNVNSVIEVALKMQKSSTYDFRSTLLSADCFFQEAVALNFLRHTNIILASGLCMNFKHLPPILVLEYMNGGSCIDFVKSERHRLTGSDFARISRDIIRACLHLANLHVVHKDIVARNVLVKKNVQTGKPEIAKLTDFGLAKDIGKRETVYASTNKETIFHMRFTAPEGFEGQFSSQSDVWSFGVFLWELYSMLDNDDPIPYSRVTPAPNYILASLKNGMTLDKPKRAPADAWFVMRQCWALEPSERPTFRQLNAAWRLIGSHAENDQTPQIYANFNEQPANVEELPLMLVHSSKECRGVTDAQPSTEGTNIAAEMSLDGYIPAVADISLPEKSEKRWAMLNSDS